MFSSFSLLFLVFYGLCFLSLSLLPFSFLSLSLPLFLVIFWRTLSHTTCFSYNLLWFSLWTLFDFGLVILWYSYCFRFQYHPPSSIHASISRYIHRSVHPSIPRSIRPPTTQNPQGGAGGSRAPWYLYHGPGGGGPVSPGTYIYIYRMHTSNDK